MGKKLRDFWARWGFYLSLAAALGLIGGTAVTCRANLFAPRPAAVASPPAVVQAMARPTPQPSPFALLTPLDGAEIAPHRPDAPFYDEALTAFTAHSGVDIAGEPGVPVRAAATGTVIALYRSPEWGWTLELDHGEGRVTRYGCLEGTGTWQPGQQVRAGEILGALGDYPCGESARGPHLHFEWLVEGESLPVPFAHPLLRPSATP